MATLTIKNLPDDLYARLKARAAEHRRSINSEAILAVEQALSTTPREPGELLAELRQRRASLRGIFLTDRALRSARRAGRE
jgi:plasmid stability protein